ncbi:type II toxin-antitoxin system VapC family toxin [Pseudonocardia nigra]|uniref:type II toxin-antitoxin system VapC family toxin n=1 Tax=Pseudonocardia nigra TaxID=1921578 RepID=UPI001C5E4BBD|nr:type II toxin-antitoxin system VapC family toxin [Pseudonocardia nigra]
MTGLLDTSVFIAAESGRPLDESRIPEDNVISVITYAELEAGVLAAGDVDTRARRLGTFNRAADIELIGIDESTALMWARMRVHLAETGRRLNVNDLWIAASAAARGLPVVTQDDDFGPVEGIGGLEVIHV